MSEEKIKEKFRRYIKIPMQIIVHMDNDLLAIEITDGIIHAVIRLPDYRQWEDDEVWHKHYARFLITEWAFEKYLAR